MGRVETTRDEWPGRVETGPREHHLRKRGFIMLKSCKINIPSKQIPFEVVVSIARTTLAWLDKPWLSNVE